jgi:HEAT repeat protein
MAQAQDAPAATGTAATAPAAGNATGTAATAPAAGNATGTAAPAPAVATDGKLADLWENLIHYIVIGQDQAALSYAKAILDAGAKPTEVYYLSARSPDSLKTLAGGRQLKGLAEPIDQLLKLIELGFSTERSDPEQIRKAIDLLAGTQRAHIRGTERLVLSGEYAVPQLLRKLEDPQITDDLREKIMLVLPKLGKEAVLPLMAALNTKNSQLMIAVANALGKLQYPTAMAVLKTVYDRKDLQEETRRVVRSALVACAGGDVSILQKPAAQLYYDLALKFYYRAESLQPDIRSELANVWYWDTNLDGLSYKPVPRQVFCDIYAMRNSRDALGSDPQFYPAVSMWLGADVKREVDLPSGAQDPTRSQDEPPARFYVLSAGAKYQQDLLARALTDRDWPVAVAAIEALGKTAGADTLVKPVAGGAQPLVEALSSSNVVVRYWAAISLALALPRERFTGSELVMPILSNALGQTGKKSAMLVAAKEETRNAIKDALRGMGFAVIDSDDPAKALDAVRAAEGVDVAVLANDPDPMAAIGMIRRDPELASLPIVVMSQTDRFRKLAKDDLRVRLVATSASNEELVAAVTDLRKEVSGAPMTPEAASEWAVRSAAAIRKLGLTRNAVYDINRTRKALIGAVGDSRAEVKTAAAEALATIPGPEAQRAIAKLATDSAADEKIRISAFAALDESVRRFGNALSDELSQAIVDIVAKTPTGDIRMAAAEVLGGLSLPSSQIKDLILQSGGIK